MKRALAAAVALVASATPALAVYSDAELIAHVRREVTDHKLVDDPACVDYVITRKIHPLYRPG